MHTRTEKSSYSPELLTILQPSGTWAGEYMKCDSVVGRTAVALIMGRWKHKEVCYYLERWVG